MAFALRVSINVNVNVFACVFGCASWIHHSVDVADDDDDDDDHHNSSEDSASKRQKTRDGQNGQRRPRHKGLCESKEERKNERTGMPFFHAAGLSAVHRPANDSRIPVTNSRHVAALTMIMGLSERLFFRLFSSRPTPFPPALPNRPMVFVCPTNNWQTSVGMRNFTSVQMGEDEHMRQPTHQENKQKTEAGRKHMDGPQPLVGRTNKNGTPQVQPHCDA